MGANEAAAAAGWASNAVYGQKIQRAAAAEKRYADIWGTMNTGSQQYSDTLANLASGLTPDALEKEGKTVDDVLSASVKMADSPAVKLARGEQ